MADPKSTKSSPAYSFYPDSFEQGTDDMTLSEVGGYIRLLNSQWAKGSVPGDNVNALSRIMRCTVPVAKSVWAVIKGKFVRDTSGAWRNARMEQERHKQETRRAKLAENGSKGAGSRWQTDGKPMANAITETASPAMAPPRQNDGLPSPSPFPGTASKSPDPPIPTPQTSSESAAGAILSPLDYERLQKSFSFVGSRLRVPHVLHREFCAKLGTGADLKLRVWYAGVNDDAEINNEPIIDVFKFLRPKFEAWATDESFNSELEKFRPRGA